jgi:hypothetical protein
MSVFKIDTEKYWAQSVMRVQKNNKPYIAARLRPKYGEGFEDIDDTGNKYIEVGLTKEEKVRKIFDQNPDSPTFGQRINDPNASVGGYRMKFDQEMTKKALDELAKMCGQSNRGSTDFTFLRRGKSGVTAESLEQLAKYETADELQHEWEVRALEYSKQKVEGN